MNVAMTCDMSKMEVQIELNDVKTRQCVANDGSLSSTLIILLLEAFACASHKVRKCSVLNSVKTVASPASDLGVKFWTVRIVEVLLARRTRALKIGSP